MTPHWRRFLRLSAAAGLVGLLSACHYHAPGPYLAYQGQYEYGGPGYGHGFSYGYGAGHGHGHHRYRRHHYRGH